VLAQESNIIQLVSANLMLGSGKEMRKWIGNVYFIQRTTSGQKVHLWCDSATQYLVENRVELFGHVKIVRDTTTITSDLGKYYGQEKRAEVSSNVRLIRGGSVLTSFFGQYFVEDKRSVFNGSVHLVDSTSSIFCDQLTYFEAESRSVAVGNVKVINLANSATIVGDTLVHFEKARYSIVTPNPRLVQIDTSSAGKVDTLVVISKIMQSYQDSLERFVAIDSVEMARGELSAKAGRATFFTKKDLIILQQHPIVWQASSQITGDSIVVGLKNRRLSTVFVKGHAVAISRSDSAYHNRYDQLTGREMTMYFSNDELEHVFVNNNATSFYYLFDNNKPNGANKASGDNITMTFLQGKIERIKIVGGVQGQYFPEKMLAKRESEYNLDGFKLYTVRPRRYKLTIVDELYD
jgi:lipopolysaccharide export system protein LptA